MNLYFRVLWVVIASFFKPKLTDILAPAILPCRVLINDLDPNVHMNNSRYLTVMDLGRFDLILRSGLFDLMIRHKSVPILSAATIRYRLPLGPFEPYDLQTRILCWDDRWFYIEQSFLIKRGNKKGAVAAIALVKGSFYSKIVKGTVPTAEVLEMLNWHHPSPPVPEHIADWQKSEETLRSRTAQPA